MLIAVAVEAGTIDLLSNWIGSNVPTFLVPIAFSLVGAVMSFFSSTTGVVCPALFPLIQSVHLHGSRRAEQCNQPLLFRRFPDSGFLWQ